MKRREKFTDEVFGYIIEEDFNPDLVIGGLLDCFDGGREIGFMQGVMFSAGLTTAGYLANKIIKKLKENTQNEF